MFYFHDPLMNTTQLPVTPPAITRVVNVPTLPPAPPKGWQWAKNTVSTASLPESKICMAWAAPVEMHQTVRVVFNPQKVIANRVEHVHTWSIVSWKNLAPSEITGTKEKVLAEVTGDLATAGIKPLKIQVFDAIHVIVALQE